MLDYDERSALSSLKGKFEFDNEREKIKKEKLGITFAIGKDRGDYNRFSSQLKRSFQKRDKENELKFIENFENGDLYKKVNNTLNNFTKEEIETKTEILTHFVNDKKKIEGLISDLSNNIEKINKALKENIEELKTKPPKKELLKKLSKGNLTEIEKKETKDKLKDINILENKILSLQRYKKFNDKYVVIEPVKKDEETNMSYTVIGDKTNGNVEIIYNGSGVNVKDWNANIRLYFKGKSSNQEAALKVAREIKEKYSTPVTVKCLDGEIRTFKELTTVNGHSKGGGEANYVASHLDLKSFTIDPAPCEYYGEYINNDKFLSVIPNNGVGTLNSIKNIPTTDAYMLEQTARSQGKGKFKATLNIVAIPVENMERTIENFLDQDHFASSKSAVENFVKAKDSIKEKLENKEKQSKIQINQNFNYSRLNSLQKGNSSNKINNEENIKIERYNLRKSDIKPKQKENIISDARII